MTDTKKQEKLDKAVRLVMHFSVSDGCTYNCEVTLPVVYSSAEALAVEFEEWCRKYKDHSDGSERKFAGHSFEPYQFFAEGTYYGPAIYTLDEWYAEEEKHFLKRNK